MRFSLAQGSKIGIFSPAGQPDEVRLARSMALIEEWGYEPVRYPGPMNARGYLAGTDRERLDATIWALSNPDLAAAWLTRGGYGITRLLPDLPFDHLKPRPVLGFSDATALLYPLYRRGWQQLVHGPVLHSLIDHAEAEVMRAFLDGHLPSFGGELVKPGRASGPLVGGNLCVLNSLTGTPEQFDGQGVILLLEDITEEPYRLDRYLTQMRHAGRLDGVVGIALGEFSECGANPVDTVLACLDWLDVPTLTDVAVGHGKLNRPFVYGSRARIDSDGLHIE
ncbi:MAG: LD-carboxypeptidase [Vulcanimicrobiota bacterium]